MAVADLGSQASIDALVRQIEESGGLTGWFTSLECPR